jgi:large subunit ribosomal protein L28
MAQRCDVCGKGPQFGNRRFNPNLVSVRAVVGSGTHQRVRVCTRCLRAGKVQKPSPRPKAKAASA